MTTSPPVARFCAVACEYRDGHYTLLVLEYATGREVWGDAPAPAPRWSDIPDLAAVRLARTGTYRVVGAWRGMPAVPDGEWFERDRTWQADVGVESGGLTGPDVRPARTSY